MSLDEDLQALAGEYVLGTLGVAERRDVLARLDTDAALRAAVDAWEQRLLPLTQLAAPEPLPSGLWQRIEAGLAPATRPAQESRKPSPAGSNASGGWWHNLALWRGLAATGFGAAMAMAVLAFIVVPPRGGRGTPQYLVVLVAPQDKAPGWVVQSDTPASLQLIPVARGTVPQQRALQFWTKGDGWTGPVSLGLVQPGQVLRVPLDKLPALQPNQLFEITLEPEAGSPTGRPTGPIQYIGRAVRVGT